MTEEKNKDTSQVSGGQLQFELPPDLEAVYTNLARISHTPAEIVMDFARLLPGQPNARVVGRMIMAPVAAKLFLRALAENLARYEAGFGEIHLPGDSKLAESLFRKQRPDE